MYFYRRIGAESGPTNFNTSSTKVGIEARIKDVLALNPEAVRADFEIITIEAWRLSR